MVALEDEVGRRSCASPTIPTPGTRLDRAPVYANKTARQLVGLQEQTGYVFPMLNDGVDSKRPGLTGLQVSDFLPVHQRLEALGCAFPDGIAVLPHNFEWAEDRAGLRHPSEASTIRTLLRNEGLAVGTIMPPQEKPHYVSLNAFGWLGPTLFVSAGLLSTNPIVFSVALGVLTNYISDLLKSTSKPQTVKLDVVVERKADRVCKRISYEGPLEGLSSLAEAVNRVANES